MAIHTNRRQFLGRATLAGLAASRVGSLEALTTTQGGPRQFTPPAGQSDAEVCAAARRELLFPPAVAFCNTATLGASPREVVDAVTDACRSVEQDLPDWPYRPKPQDVPPMSGYLALPQFREEVGRVINAPLDELAFTQNATMAMNFVANGLDLAPGDEILTTDQEHGGGISPWLLREQRHGIIVRQVPLAPALARGPDAVVALFEAAMTPRTRVLMFSHVTAVLGARLPARRLCALARDRGVLCVVDGAQAVGQIRVDVKDLDCDAYVTSTHKWLVAPKGTGLLYIRRAAQDRIWTTLATGGFDNRSAGAVRFMRFGTGSMPVVHGLVAAVRFMNRLDLGRVERWDAMLTARLRDGLARMAHVQVASPLHPDLTAAMTTFAVRGHSSGDVQDELWKHRIRVRAEGEAGVRLSAHFYVAPADIDRILDVVKGLRP